MSDLISRQAAIEVLSVDADLLRRVLDNTDIVGAERAKARWGLGLIESCISDIKELPSAESNIEKAFRLFVNWADECGFGYDNIHDLYEEYRDDIRAKGLSYIDGLMYIAKMEVERGAYVRED